MSHADKVYTEFVVVRCVQAQNAPNTYLAGAVPWTPLGEFRMLPRLPNRLGRGYPIHLPLNAFGAWNAVPNFYNRLMVTL